MSHDEEDFAALLAEYEQQAPTLGKLEVGDVVTGRVVSIGDDAVFVELGAKSEGMLEREQVTNDDGEIEVAIGDEVEARVVDTGRKTGCVMLRRTMGRGPKAIEDLTQAHAMGLPVEGQVTGTNKGGFEVQIAGVRAFCPVSQIDTRFVENPEDWVGGRHQFRITKLEQGRGDRVDLVVSRRAILEEEAKEKAVETRAKLREGMAISGTVTSIKPYGAFVDIGGLEGMIHISELGHARVGDPSEVVQPDQKVEVAILRMEEKSDGGLKIGLSLKAMQTDPWEETARQLKVGQSLRGRVVRTQPFGAFVEIAPGVEGLVHISELGAGRRINHPREVVSEGQEVDVTVLSVELPRKRIGLSMASERAEATAEQPADPGQHDDSGKSLGTLGDLLSKSLKK